MLGNILKGKRNDVQCAFNAGFVWAVPCPKTVNFLEIVWKFGVLYKFIIYNSNSFFVSVVLSHKETTFW